MGSDVWASFPSLPQAGHKLGVKQAEPVEDNWHHLPAQSSLPVLLPQPPRSWDCRCVPPCLAHALYCKTFFHSVCKEHKSGTCSSKCCNACGHLNISIATPKCTSHLQVYERTHTQYLPLGLCVGNPGHVPSYSSPQFMHLSDGVSCCQMGCFTD